MHFHNKNANKNNYTIKNKINQNHKKSKWINLKVYLQNQNKLNNKIKSQYNNINKNINQNKIN